MLPVAGQQFQNREMSTIQTYIRIDGVGFACTEHRANNGPNGVLVFGASLSDHFTL